VQVLPGAKTEVKSGNGQPHPELTGILLHSPSALIKSQALSRGAAANLAITGTRADRHR
jgi:hypothetical protein